MEDVPVSSTDGTLVCSSAQTVVLTSVKPTAENLVDISNRVDDEGKIELRIDHRCDMTDYAFALIAHPPTASQLAYCEERRTKERRWRNFLRELTTPLTMEELFPQKTVTV